MTIFLGAKPFDQKNVHLGLQVDNTKQSVVLLMYLLYARFRSLTVNNSGPKNWSYAWKENGTQERTGKSMMSVTRMNKNMQEASWLERAVDSAGHLSASQTVKGEVLLFCLLRRKWGACNDKKLQDFASPFPAFALRVSSCKV